MKRILVIFGTRPEAIKLAPVISTLSENKNFEPRVCVTGQHREMLDQMLSLFEIKPTYDLEIMSTDQQLAEVTSRALKGLVKVLKKEEPACTIVQGDTTTAFAGALASFYCKTLVAHVEAGLRSKDKMNPFPEEINRKLADALSDFYFAPTEISKRNLVREGVPQNQILVTGNTVIDSLLFISTKLSDGELQPELPFDLTPYETTNKPLIVVTAHRRENFGPGLKAICEALREIASKFPEVKIVYPVHLNPNVRKPVKEILKGIPNILLTEPLKYLEFVKLMQVARIIITDSGGIQEEAPSLGVPVLVTRDKTERPEAIEAGTAKLVGTDTERIIKQTSKILQDNKLFSEMAKRKNPYGDGDASKRIVNFLQKHLH